MIALEEALRIENGGITKKELQQRIGKCLLEMKKKDIGLMYIYGDAVNPGNLVYLTNYAPLESISRGTLPIALSFFSQKMESRLSFLTETG
ncbi:MAG: hypothetical protein WCO26_06485 [Deltaproteobacteria bacterium]